MKKFVLPIALSLWASLVTAQALEDINWLTEEYPPFNYKEDGELKGIAVDFLVEIWKKLGVKKTKADIKLVPWARGVKTLESQPNTCLFSTTLTANRLNVRGWKFAYPIPRIREDSENQLIARVDKNLSFNSVNDVLNYKGNFGVVRGDVGASLLLDLGVGDHKLERTSEPKQLTLMLHAGRFDVASYSIDAMQKAMNQEGIDPTLYENIYAFPLSPLGYAFHHNIHPKILKKIQQAIDELHAEGVAEEIVQRYMPTDTKTPMQ